MKKYVSPETELVKFNTEDVITVSGSVDAWNQANYNGNATQLNWNNLSETAFFDF